MDKSLLLELWWKMKHMKDSILKNYVVTATDRQHNSWLRAPFGSKSFQEGGGYTKVGIHSCPTSH